MSLKSIMTIKSSLKSLLQFYALVLRAIVAKPQTAVAYSFTHSLVKQQNANRLWHAAEYV